MSQHAQTRLQRFSMIFLVIALIAASAAGISRSAISAWDGTSAASFASGKGTEYDPYIIKTEQQLGYFVSQLANGVTYEGLYIALDADLDMTGGTWGSEDGQFKGTFDGCGYTVKAQCPFFNMIGEGGTVKRLTYRVLEETDRAVLTETNCGTVESCLVSGTVVDGYDRGALLVTYNYGTVANCGAVGSADGDGDDANCYVGMIAHNYSSGTVKNCYSAMSLSGSAPGRYNTLYLGAVVAQNQGTQTDCWFDSSLTGAKDSYATGLTTAQMQEASFVDSMNANLYPGVMWAQDTANVNGGYPVLEPCIDGQAYLTVTDKAVDTYNTKNITVGFYGVGSDVTCYYTLDGSDPRISATREVYSYTSFTVSGEEVVVRSVLCKNGAYSAVNTQRLIYLPGKGTSVSPYRISTKLQLDALRLDMTAHYRLENDITFTSADFASGGIAAGGWKPFGSGGGNAVAFTGSFNGQGHAIFGLTGNDGGFFELNEGTIDALRIVDHTLYGSDDFGAVADRNYGSILRCYVKSAYTLDTLPRAAESVYKIYAGGVAGANYGTVSYCRNDGIVAAHSTMRYNELYAGGIAGCSTLSDGVTHCWNTGTVAAHSTTTTEFAYVGGILGSGTARNCRNTGDIYLNVALDYDQFAGGICGHFYSNLAWKCVADELTVTGKTDRLSRYDFASSGYNNNYFISEELSYAPYTNTSDTEYSLDFENDWMITADGPVPRGVMDADGHCYDAVSTVLPSGDTAGTVELECTICGDIREEILGGSGEAHRFTNYVSDNNATCSADGTKTALCDCGCGATDTVTDEGSILPHTAVTDPAVAATCVAAGKTEGSHCSACGTVLTAQQTVPALGHSYVSGVCSRCGTQDPSAIVGQRGQCGDNAFYVFDSSSGTLTVYGTGSTWDWGWTFAGGKYTPWYDVLNSILHIVVEPGITWIGENAFYQCVNATKVTLNEGLIGTKQAAFRDCHSLTEVVLPQSMTSLGDLSFMSCTSLPEVTIPDNITYIGEQAFNYCSNLQKVVMSDSLTSIGRKAFAVCEMLHDVTLSKNLTYIGTSAFEDCEILQKIEFPESLIDIGQSAFHGCISLKSITIPESVTTIRDGAFSDCRSLKKVVIPDTVTSLGGAFSECINLEEVTLPKGLKTISGFSHCDKLVTIDIPDSVTKIGSAAFYDCDKLSSIRIPDGVTEIERMAFSTTRSLKELTIPDSVLKIGEQAFALTFELEKLNIPASVIKIGPDAFQYSRVKEIYYGGTQEEWESAILTSATTFPENTIVHFNVACFHEFTNYVSDNNATCTANGTLTAQCDRGCGTTDTVIEYGSILGHTEAIDKAVEATCTETGLTEGKHCSVCNVVLVAQQTVSAKGHNYAGGVCSRCGGNDPSFQCGNNAFWNFDPSTGTLTIFGSGAATQQGWSAYKNQIKTVVVQPGITELGTELFYQHANLQKAVLPEGLHTIGRHTFYQCSALAEVNFPDSLTTLGGCAFCYCTSLKEVDLPDGLTAIRDYTFYGCTALSKLHLPESLTTIEIAAFYDCDSLTEVELPDGVVTFATRAFYDCDSLKRIKLADGITSIGEYTFYGSAALEEVVFPKNLKTIERAAFEYCPALKAAILPDGVESIGNVAFYGCTAMTELRLPDSITYLGDCAVYECSSLTSVNIPDSLTTIKGDTFRFCTNLKSVTIPAGITGIEAYAFTCCEEIYFEGNAPTIFEHEIFSSNATIYCKESASGWMDSPAFDAAAQTWNGYKLMYDAPCSDHRNLVVTPGYPATCTEEGLTDSGYCTFCGEMAILQEVIPALGHTVVTDPAVAATCTTAGKTQGTHCSVCAEVLSAQEMVSALGHTVVTDKAVSATCTESGLTEGKHCSVCDAVLSVQQIVPAKGHTEVVDAAVSATCTAEGKTAGKHCSVCNVVLVPQQSVAAKGHVWDGGVVTKQPTETAEGEKKFTCTACGETKLQSVPVLSHTHKYEKAVTAPTCTEDGYTTYTCRCGDSYKGDYVAAKGHTEVIDKAVVATCTTSGKTEGKHCDLCHAVLVAQQIVPAKGHTEVVDAAVSATCTAEGKTAGKHCSVCNVVLVPQQSVAAKGHVWDGGVVTKQPTETAEGEKKFTCTACGETKLQSVPVLSHTHKYEKAVTAPTCTEDGYTTYTCRCGDSYKGDYVAAKGHTEVVDKAVSATCTESGLTEGKHCSVCNAVLAVQQIVPAKGHTEVVDKAVAATCTAEGKTAGKHCSVCNVVLVPQQSVAAKGHVWDGGVVTKQPTETAEGEKKFTCTACGETKLQSVPVLSHTHKYEKTVTAPTCTEEGYTTYVCKCGDSYKDEYVAAKGHVYDNDRDADCNACGAVREVETAKSRVSGKVKNSRGAKVRLGSYETETKGAYEFSDVEEGTYDLTIREAGCLTYTVKNITVGESPVTLPEISLVRGDTNGDDMINIMDMGCFRQNFGKSGASIANPYADTNGDNMVNIIDMSTFRTNFGKTAAKDCTVNY